ncbi:zf-HC2 domain-containing protein [Amycolatopsis sp. FDAARGOS 1241]|uniref:zf-HC2 domain-containing protein n=1 Tax=Amycolatopsis sp. FDAARGOS 1241 TaxID=2778070 RepID=UPI00195191CC|nr:zf-HC2 domain-containing protein [Amycolatopsis sp. FDAARGOS 1241]QRP48934.1 zf-HC2 domain-containing protein [Amycolatopsis sp. FDAARGOS 1241]
MSAVEQEHAQLGAYVLGALEPAEAAEFERHLVTCAQCRFELKDFSALREALDEVPPEAFLDGPPEGGDLLLQRTLRRIRTEQEQAAPVQAPRRTGQRRGLVLVAAAVVAVVALGGGVVIGRQTAPETSTQQVAVPGTRDVSATNAATGASLTASVVPAPGWVRVHVSVKGIPAGERCKLVVTAKDGAQWDAGSWLVSEKWSTQGFGLDGSAVVAPADVASVGIVTLDGRDLVSAKV